MPPDVAIMRRQERMRQKEEAKIQKTIAQKQKQMVAMAAKEKAEKVRLRSVRTCTN